MFDTTTMVERELSTGTVVRLRIEELDQETVMVHDAWRRRGDGNWKRWPNVEGEQSPGEIRLDLCHEVDPAAD